MASFMLGFMMMPATVGLIAGFATLGMHYKLDHGLAIAGAATGVATLILGIVVAGLTIGR